MQMYDLVISTSVNNDMKMLRNLVKVDRLNKVSGDLSREEVYSILRTSLMNKDLELTQNQKLIINEVPDSDYSDQKELTLGKIIKALAFEGLFINLFKVASEVSTETPVGTLLYVEINSSKDRILPVSEAVFREYDSDSGKSACDILVESMDTVINGPANVMDVIGVADYKATKAAMAKMGTPFFDANLERLYNSFGATPYILN